MRTGLIRTAAAAGIALGGVMVGPAMAQAAPAEQCVLYAGETSPQCFSDSLARSSFEGESAMASWVTVGIFYDAAGYSNARGQLVVKAPRGCDADTTSPDWSWSSITPAWNNRVSSFVTRNRCDLKGYTGANYTGDRFARYQDHDRGLVRFNNNITSFRMS